jgi:hypothetical protein
MLAITNIDAAITNVAVIQRMLEGHWTEPRSEKERNILEGLQATAIQLQEVKKDISTDMVRRVQ